MLIPTITREQLAKIYGVSQGFLGYLLRERKVPLPVQIGTEPLWFADEVDASLPKIKAFVAKKNKVN